VWTPEQKARLVHAIEHQGLSHRAAHLDARMSLAAELSMLGVTDVSETRVRHWLLNYAARLKKIDPVRARAFMRDMSERGNNRAPSSSSKKTNKRVKREEDSPHKSTTTTTRRKARRTMSTMAAPRCWRGGGGTARFRCCGGSVGCCV